MKNKTLIVLAVAFVSACFLSVKTNVRASSLPNEALSITKDDLSRAGYAGVVKQEPRDGNYPAPNAYFSVTEDTQDNGHSNNLVMVSLYRSDSAYTEALFRYGDAVHPVVVAGARAQEGQFYGRTALNFAKGNYYAVIIGPNTQKVEKLAEIVADKIQ